MAKLEPGQIQSSPIVTFAFDHVFYGFNKIFLLIKGNMCAMLYRIHLSMAKVVRTNIIQTNVDR